MTPGEALLGCDREGQVAASQDADRRCAEIDAQLLRGELTLDQAKQYYLKAITGQP